MLDAWFSWCRISSWSPANRWRHWWWNLLLLVDKQKKNNEGHHSHQAVYSYLKDVSGKTPFRRRVFWFVLYFSFLFIHDKRDSAAALKLSTWVGRFVSYVSYFWCTDVNRRIHILPFLSCVLLPSVLLYQGRSRGRRFKMLFCVGTFDGTFERTGSEVSQLAVSSLQSTFNRSPAVELAY